MKNKDLLNSPEFSLHPLDVERIVKAIIRDEYSLDEASNFYKEFISKITSAKKAWAFLDIRATEFPNNTLYDPLYTNVSRSKDPSFNLAAWVKKIVNENDYSIYIEKSVFFTDKIDSPEIESAQFSLEEYKGQPLYKLEIKSNISTTEMRFALSTMRNFKLEFVLLCKKNQEDLIRNINYVIFDAYDWDGYIILKLEDEE